MDRNYSDEQLLRIIDQAMVYQCACPAQVASVMRELRRVHQYQLRCLNLSGTDEMVHQRISEDVRKSHEVMEACLGEVLRLEGWDMETLTMPENLKKQMREENAEGD
ncbi:hypothetical protein Ga0123462_0024 [Mariprofundus ferrinatatus]|uniref:Uncharacterized protein n=1 Tax=Mariprofundus ferrinatatus TaxID=1921087 RepID=A0A2K8L0Y8_9PROT|nr:hypothetical protein [Mariprofundus ferrinatatus]ATX80903.1 hypothetical protein Ga0123462_0024 [Mariprofundus ferrinatatus]